MKFLFTLLAIIVTFLSNYAQAPERFQYQAVARGAGGTVLTNQNVSLRISILEGALDGSPVFTETHTTTTNEFGLVTLQIGSGTAVVGQISSIDWSSNIYFLKVEMDEQGGESYEFMGSNQLLSVPYALYAESAGNVFSGQYADLSGTPVNVSELSNDAGYLTGEEDGSTTNEIQSLSDVLIVGNDAGGQKISNLADPENPQDAVTIGYLKELMNRVETLEKKSGLKIYSDTLIDVEGNQYRAVEIGNQLWMVDNLRTTKYAYGADINGDVVYDGLEANAEKFGRLYPWNAVMDGSSSSSYNPSYIQGVCPDDWHVPSDAEWKELEMYLGMSEADANLENTWRGVTNEGGKLKGLDFTWDSPNTGATNSSGFDALPTGLYTTQFLGINIQCHFYTATQSGIDNAFNRALINSRSDILRGSAYNKTYAMSVRCVKNRYPVLHNALGSVSEVQNSAYGPDGTIRGSVNFNNDVKFGKGITPNTGDAGSGVDFPSTILNPEAGCIEMWSEFYNTPSAGTYGVYGFVNVAHWDQNPLSLYWHNSTSKLEGTLAFGATAIGVTLTGFNPALNSPVHIAMVWDRNGIDGSVDFVRLYVDGNIVAVNSTDNSWGTDSSGNLRVAAPWDDQFSTDRYSVDNIKVWDYAKSDFTNRIFE